MGTGKVIYMNIITDTCAVRSIIICTEYDKYSELCKEQNMKVENIVTYDKDMPKENNKFML